MLVSAVKITLLGAMISIESVLIPQAFNKVTEYLPGALTV